MFHHHHHHHQLYGIHKPYLQSSYKAWSDMEHGEHYESISTPLNQRVAKHLKIAFWLRVVWYIDKLWLSRYDPSSYISSANRISICRSQVRPLSPVYWRYINIMFTAHYTVMLTVIVIIILKVVQPFPNLPVKCHHPEILQIQVFTNKSCISTNVRAVIIEW